MNLFTIAFKSLRYRSVASSLTTLSVALGIMMMVAVLVIHGIVNETFTQRSIGVSLVVGPKGSDVGMVLNSVFRVGKAGEPLPYRYYTETILGKDKEWAQWIESAIPLTMGDVTQEGSFPIVGTTAEYFLLSYAAGQQFAVKGELPRRPFEAVIGQNVAKANGWGLGSQLQLVHGGADGHTHDEKFTVVGLLGPTGTANDKTVFVNIEGFFQISGHEKPPAEAIRRLRDFGFEVTPAQEARLLKADDHAGHDHAGHNHAVPDDLKEVSYIFVNTTNGSESITLRGLINEGKVAQAVNPIMIMSQLMRDLVGSIELLLLFLTGLIVVVAGIGIFVSIYNSMADRRREIAIMRSLGAHRTTVLGIILGEAVLLCVGGGTLGFLLGHGLVVLAAPIVEARAGLLIDPWKFELLELFLFPALLAMAVLVGVLPGLTAYRTDVAQSLSE